MKIFTNAKAVVDIGLRKTATFVAKTLSCVLFIKETLDPKIKLYKDNLII